MTDSKNPDFREQFRRSLVKIAELKAEIAKLDAEKTEPIAIVGMACRFPGADTPEKFWGVLARGEDHIRRVPDERVVEVWPEEVPRWAGVLDRVDEFDPEFFGISPREALALDPQQRLGLEVAWEALEDAFIIPGDLQGSRTGVYLGLCTNDYGHRVLSRPLAQRDVYGSTGNIASTAAGRIAYTLGLLGPTIAIDTACSSSLVAVHLACASLRDRESDLMLAGGVNLILSEQSTVVLAPLQALSPDGRCRTFDASANGFVRGEGCGFVVLERLSDARRNRRRILAVVAGSAINQDGRSTGLTAPNVLAQQALLREALQRAQISSEQVSYLECHGTGTSLGDPIEVEAIRASMGGPSDKRLWLGALKTNIGHLEGAAGIAGLIKVVLALRHGALPRILNLRHVNPRLALSGSRLALLTENVDWPAGAQPRYAGVSGFGLSGTNAHVILSDVPIEDATAVPSAPVSNAIVPLIVSGRSANAAQGQWAKLQQWCEGRTDCNVVHVAATLATARTHFEWRMLGLGSLAGLRAAWGPVRVNPRAKLAMLFTGQGSQRIGMGRELLSTHRVFSDIFEEICGEFDAWVRPALREVMFADDSSTLDRTEYTQPALFALEVALFRTYEAWGVRPDVLLGHSIGELVAAHVAGVLTLPDACKLVAARGRLMQALPEGGAMVSIQASEPEVLEVLERHPGADIAGLNGPLSTVVSGDESPVLAIAGHFERLGRKTTRLTVSHAFHSHRMDGMLDAFREVVATVKLSAPRIPIVSNVTGKLATSEDLGSVEYWVRHVRQAVRFVDGVRTLEERGVSTLLELGPYGVLSAMASGCLSDSAQSTTVLVTSMRRDRSEAETLALAVGTLHCQGVAVDWPAYFEPHAAQRVELPTYAFQRERYWLEPLARKHTNVELAGLEPSEHPLLGVMVRLAESGAYLFTSRLSLNEQPWLGDHVVLGHVLFPGTGFLDLALSAGHRVGAGALEDLTLEAPLVLERDQACNLQLLVMAPDAEGRRGLTIHSKLDGARNWTLHGSGSLVTGVGSPGLDQGEWPPPGAVESDSVDLYDRLVSIGLSYGPSFRGLMRSWSVADVRHVEVKLPDGLSADGFTIHPALLDAALHALAADLVGGQAISLPFAWSGVSVFAAGATEMRVRLSPMNSGFRLDVADSSGHPMLRVDLLAVRPASISNIRDVIARRQLDSLYRVDWRPIDGVAGLPGKHVLVSEDDSLATVLGMERVEQFDVLPAETGVVFLPCFASSADTPLMAAVTLLDRLQVWLADERRKATRLVILTRRAVAVEPGEDILDLAHAPLWGLLRSAQVEYPDHALSIVDVDGEVETLRGVAVALGSGEPQLGLRRGRAFVPRLAAGSSDILEFPPGARAWYLQSSARGTFENLQFVAHEEILGSLEPGQVRIGVRATGINFRDVLNALGMYPGDPGPLGYEGAGVVVAVGPGVESLKVGDRVFGLLHAGFGSHSVIDHRVVTRMPEGWSFVQGASAALVFLTAYYALVDLADLRPGERILIHAAAGGVGMAAAQIARILGAEVYGTASPSKWDVLRACGFDEHHIANSRTLAFEQQFLAATHDEGFDVVLDALAREFVDASLRLLPRGGRFLEMGKTDVRDADEVARLHPGVGYRAFDLLEAGPDRIHEMLRKLVGLFERGTLDLLPIKSWDVRAAVEAFRFVGQAKHVGKVVLTAAPTFDCEGTVLITGAPGALGGMVARHLVEHHGVRHLLLCSRRGLDAPGAGDLVGELESLGAHVRIVSCDVADRRMIADVLDTISKTHPLTAIFHTAGVVDDGVLGMLDGARFSTVFGPKVDAATHLDELSRALDVQTFVLFSSVAGTCGGAGQANYAAANAFLDALCVHRRAQGLSALSLAWGPWAEVGMASRLGSADIARMRRLGIQLLSPKEGLELLDTALGRSESVLLPMRLDIKALQQLETVPPMLRGLVQSEPRRTAQVTATVESHMDLRQRFASLSESARQERVLEIVRGEVAIVLGMKGQIDDSQSAHDLGLDSLMAVEVRNRLQRLTGLTLSSTLLFEHPVLSDLANHILDRLALPPASPKRTEPVDSVSSMLKVCNGAAAEMLGRGSGKGSSMSGITRLLRDAVASGANDLAEKLIGALTALRENETDFAPDESPTPFLLAPGPRGVKVQLYCIPSIAAPSTPLQFAKLAPGLGRGAVVWSISNPGYGVRQRIVGDRAKFIDFHMEAIRGCREDLPLGVLGYSAGGWVAVDLVQRLEEEGHQVAGLILLDSPVSPIMSPLPASELRVARALLDALLAGDSIYTEEEVVFQLVSMFRAFEMYNHWVPGTLSTPTLYVRAEGGYSSVAVSTDTVAHSDLWAPHLRAMTIRSVAADHFGLVVDESGSVAEAVLSWTSSLA